MPPKVLFITMSMDLLILDQISKIYLDMKLNEPLLLISDFLKIQVSHNPGMAFGITFPYAIQLLLNILFFCLIIYYLYKTLNFSRKLSAVSIALVFSGALGNIVDRIRLGYVIDFISIGNFPIFNLADVYITIAVFILILFYDKIKKVEK